MRLPLFLPTYFGVLVSIAFLYPVTDPPQAGPIDPMSLDSFPACWSLERRDWEGKPYLSGPFPLTRLPLTFPFDTTWYEASQNWHGMIAWRPAPGDSFDIALYHDPTIRFPRAEGPVTGRVYFSNQPNLMSAWLTQPEFATGRVADCSESLVLGMPR